MWSVTLGSTVNRGRSLAICAATGLLLVGGCDSGTARSATPVARPAAGATSMSSLDAPVCAATDAHAGHSSAGLGCATCHGCGGGTVALSSIVLPGGTTTAGGSITVGDPTTCTVACHYPFNAPPHTVAWNEPGPLACTSCHAPTAVPSGVRSSHPGAFVESTGEPMACQSCHDTSAHLSGTPRLVTENGRVDATCMDCHDGSGRALSGRTPPLVVGFSESGDDWHGARAGAGWGGTLVAPYGRGQGPLPCTACHDAHTSANAFLLAADVNGVAVTAQIDRAGVGAEALCEGCHRGDRHAGCFATCHRPNNVPTDPAPAGKPCFYCHGHEGIVTWNISCHGCHNQRLPAPEQVPPLITMRVGAIGVPGDSGIPAWIRVKDVGVTSATIAWATDEESTSYVEYGVAPPGNISGSSTLTVDHQVVLAGLSEHTSYVFRVRSSDRMRNVVWSPLLTFTTAWRSGPLAPTLVPIGGVTGSTVTLVWSAVADPEGDPVQYRLQVDDSPLFDTPEVDSGWIESTSFTANLRLGARHHSRVMARDSAHDLWSPWSTTEWFWCWPESGD